MTTNLQEAPLLSDNTDQSTKNEIKDNKSLIYWIAMLLGCGILTAYNFLLSAPDYFSQQYTDYPNLNMLIVPAYTIPDVVFLILAVFYGHLFSFTSRIVICFLLMGVALLFPIFTQYVSSSQQIGFYTVLGISGFCGVTTAVLQTAIVGFCNYLPTNYIQVSISGQSVAGIIAGGTRIAINFIEQNTSISARTNGMVYFSIGALIDAACAIAFLYAIRSAFVKFHLSEYFWTRKFRPSVAQSDAQSSLLERTDTQTILRKLVGDDSVSTPTAKDFKSVTYPQSNTSTNVPQIIAGRKETKQKKKRKRTAKEKRLAAAIEQQQKTYMKFRDTTHDTDSEESSSDLTTDDECDNVERVEITRSTQSTNQILSDGTCTHSINSVHVRSTLSVDMNDIEESKQEKNIVADEVTYCGVFNKIKALVWSVFLVFFITFLVFPGMITSLKSQYKWVNDHNWLPVWLVMEFNIMDFIGRQFVAAYTTCSFSKRTLWIGCFWRILIYPLFVVMYRGVIRNDFVAYSAVAILGITNGHFCCLSFMWAPSLVTPQEQQLCGSIMSFALVMGITLGSNVALLLTSVGVL